MVVTLGSVVASDETRKRTSCKALWVNVLNVNFTNIIRAILGYNTETRILYSTSIIDTKKTNKCELDLRNTVRLSFDMIVFPHEY